MDSAVIFHRLQFAFTVTYHYIFPQLTMGLALLIVILKTLALKTGDERFNHAARFWAKIFAINFGMGVVTGIPIIPVRHELGEFSRRRGRHRPDARNGGQFAFFLESASSDSSSSAKSARQSATGSGCRVPRIVAVRLLHHRDRCVDAASGRLTRSDGEIHLTSFSALLLNPWALWQYLHNMGGAVVTGSFVDGGARRLLRLGREHEEYGKDLRDASASRRVCASALLSCSRQATGRARSCRVSAPTLAAMEGLFHTKTGAGIVSSVSRTSTQSASTIRSRCPALLSFLTYQRWGAEVKGSTHSRRNVAGQHASALLQLPHHGRARDDLHRDHGARGVAALATASCSKHAGCYGS